jgi:hypothetical protein
MTSALRYGATLAVLALFSTGHQSIAQTLSAATPSPSPRSVKLSGFALSQIAALRAEKAARTPIQQKIESNLFRAALLARPIVQANALKTGPLSAGPLSAATLSLLKTVHISQNAQPDAHGMVLVDIKGTVSSGLLAKIQGAGGVVQGSWPAFGAIRASMPVTQLETIAASAAVLSVRPAAHGHVLRNRLAPLPGQASAGQPLVPGLPVLTEAPAAEAPAKTEAAREASVKSHLPAILAHVRAEQATRTGGFASFSLAALGGGLVNNADPEGDLAQRAALARQKFGVNGAGIKIGVLSDSVDGLAGEQRLNRLGPVTVLPGQSGVPGTGEGTAMLEIVHRLAPGAQLYFATAYDTPENFASNILALQQAGCNVIVDDVAYFDEPPFQDGVIAQAVDTVSAAGAYYFSSAGNNYNVDQEGIAANWEGNFVDEGTFDPDFAGYLAYDSDGDDANQVLTVPGYEQQDAFLFWADPQSTDTSGATDDYDLFVLDPNTDAVVYSSTDPHTGQPGQDPIQACEADQGDLIVVTKNHGNAVDLHLFLTSDGAAALNIATPGGTFGHAASAKCYGTAAADASVPYGQGRAFNSSDVTEAFSSDGPRRIIFNPDGSEITPGNRTSTGGTLRQAPVLTSSDGISDFFDPFYGTSAAAPHAAAIAALVLSADPALKNQPVQMFNLLTGACIPFDGSLEAATPNRDSGYGLLDAYNAVQASVARGGK